MTHILEDLSHKIGAPRPKKEVSRFRGMYTVSMSLYSNGSLCLGTRYFIGAAEEVGTQHGSKDVFSKNQLLHWKNMEKRLLGRWAYLVHHLEIENPINVLLPWLSARLNAGSDTGGFSTQIDGETLAKWQNLYSIAFGGRWFWGTIFWKTA